MQPRTRRQKDVLDVITRYIDSNGHLPSYAAIARHLGVRSRGGIAKHVTALESQGLIRRRAGEGGFRLELCGKEKVESESRIVEWLDAVVPAASAEAWEREPFAVPRFILGMYADADIFAFRVQDDAMLDKAIAEGDVVIIERRTFAREGSIVAAHTAVGDIVLRRYYREGSQVALRSANDDFDEIRSPADAVRILGIFRSLLRPPG